MAYNTLQRKNSEESVCKHQAIDKVRCHFFTSSKPTFFFQNNNSNKKREKKNLREEIKQRDELPGETKLYIGGALGAAAPGLEYEE